MREFDENFEDSNFVNTLLVEFFADRVYRHCFMKLMTKSDTLYIFKDCKLQEWGTLSNALS